MRDYLAKITCNKHFLFYSTDIISFGRCYLCLRFYITLQILFPISDMGLWSYYAVFDIPCLSFERFWQVSVDTLVGLFNIFNTKIHLMWQYSKIFTSIYTLYFSYSYFHNILMSFTGINSIINGSSPGSGTPTLT